MRHTEKTEFLTWLQNELKTQPNSDFNKIVLDKIKHLLRPGYKNIYSYKDHPDYSED